MVSFQGGFVTVGRIRGVPVRVHWTALAGALFFSGFAFRPGAWLGFGLLILVHELGHAHLIRRYRLRVLAIDIHGLGGLCHWGGGATPRQRAVIAWGGVLAQAALLVATVLAVSLLGPLGPFAMDLVEAWTMSNLWLIALNLIPFQPFDGANAWALFRILLAERRFEARAPEARPRPPPAPVSRAHLRVVPPERPGAHDAVPPLPPDVRKALDRILEQVERDAKAKRRSGKESN